MPKQMQTALSILSVFIVVLFSATVSAEVQLSTGKYHETVEDLRVKVLGGFVILDRTWYDGRWQFNRRWNPLMLRYDALDGSLKAIERNGDSYTKADTVGAVFTFGKRLTIAVTATGFRWQDREGNWIDYDATGRMTAYGDRNNVEVTVTYDAAGLLSGVKDHLGIQVLWFEYDDHGQLTTIRDPADRRVQYHYTDHRLTMVTDVSGNDWRYQYDSQGRLIGKTDAEGRQTTISYGSTGMVTGIKDQNGIGPGYSYENDSSKELFYVQVKSSSGRVDEYWYNPEGLETRHDLNGRTIGTLTIDNRKQTVTDELGRATVTDYDEWDNPIKITYPDGSTVTYEYDRYSNITRHVDENGVATLNQYDDRGNLIRKTEAVGTAVQRVTEYSYDPYGRCSIGKRLGDAVTAEAVTAQTYDDKGNILMVTDPEGYIAKYAYDVMGNTVEFIDGRGKIWKHIYDNSGHLLQRTNPLGHENRYQYDKVGNLVKEINAANQITRYEYDNRNNPIKKIDAYGNTRLFTYDTDNHLTSITDEEKKVDRFGYDIDRRWNKIIYGSGNVITFEYGNAENNADSSKISAAIYPTYTAKYYYDNRGHHIATHKFISDQKAFIDSRTYDKVGNVMTEKDELGRIERKEYDALNRLTVITNHQGNNLKFSYDNRDNPVGTTNQKNILIRRFKFDRNNRLLEEIWPDGNKSVYEYDGCDNVTKKIDGKGRLTIYIYDDVNRQIKKYVYENASATTPVLTTEYAYDELGNLLSYKDATTTGNYSYDNLKNKTTDTINYKSFTLSNHYEYYKNGYLKAFTNPDNSRIEYTYDSGNRLTSISLPDEGTIIFKRYHWFAPEQITLPGGGTQVYEYDRLMRPYHISSKDPAGNTLLDYTLIYDAVGNVIQKRTEHGEYNYEYDNLDRLIKAQSPTSANELFTYDPVGNRLTDVHFDNWLYNEQDQLINYGDHSYQYDANGNRTLNSEFSDNIQYHYNAENRLIEISNNNNLIAKYAYDPMGRRISKTVNAKTIYYIYSDEGLIGEYDESGQPLRLYGYIPRSSWSTKPLFIREGKNYAYYHTDHLGTPQKLTDKNGSVQWSAIYDSFGRAHIQNTSIINNLRFPGQYFDIETKTHSNYSRDYEPDSGRYIQPDPVGLRGGVNVYIYSDNNPLKNLNRSGVDNIGCDGVPDIFETPCRESLKFKFNRYPFNSLTHE
ncbi:MAG: RHS repeat-associated core domain-containing protein [Candidatus Competibacteraceae bacterium]